MTNKTLNQREFFRVDIQMDTKFKILKPGEKDLDILFSNSHNGVITDLSAGGAAIQSEVQLEPGTLLKIQLTHLGEYISPVKAAVMRAEQMQDGIYKAGVKFQELGDSEIKTILKYLNKQKIIQTRRSCRV